MKTKYIFLTTFLIALILSFNFPEIFLRPGSIHKVHEKIESDCIKCHTLFSSDSDANCVQCHKEGKITRASRKEVSLQEENEFIRSDVDFHPALAKSTCTECHREHQGVQGDLTKKFLHSAIDQNNQKNCSSCHIIPADKKHNQISTACHSCHNVQEWQNASFKHPLANSNCLECHKAPVAPVGKKQMMHTDAHNNCAKCHNIKNWNQTNFIHPDKDSKCFDCHNLPSKSKFKHSSSDKNCNKCHTIESWKATMAKVDHDKYFKLKKRHNVSCSKCHTGENYQSYSCYGCHAHSKRGVAREHSRLKIENLEKCTDCHRSSSEKDAWKRYRLLKKNQ